jgi:DsbC/DsbD-like thiol-disulfide interchange protein
VCSLALTPQVATAPTMLNVALDFGVCEVVCVPARVETSITVSPGRVDERALAWSRKRVRWCPGPAVDGLFAVSSVDVTANPRHGRPAGDGRSYHAGIRRGAVRRGAGRLDRVAGADRRTLRPERRFAFTLERPADNMPVAGVELVLTTVSGNAAIEQLLTLK